jgi:hypothetical protein
MTKGLSAREVETLVGLLRRVLVNVEAMEAASQLARAEGGHKAD